MPCFKPLDAFRSLTKKTKNGKQFITFDVTNAGNKFEHITLPCGRCIGCRIDKSRSWAVRATHEASLYNYNSYITLTYSDENMPKNRSLIRPEISLFMKKLRRKNKGFDIVINKDKPTYPIRYFGCGEYGESLDRPHYHVCLFNYDFPDRYYWTMIRGKKYYRSDILEETWDKGISLISDLTFQSAAYVARYVCKKIGGDKAITHYLDLDEDTGEIYGKKEPEFTACSTMPGIGRRWIEKYHSEVYEKDFVTVEGKKYSTPPYYDKVYSVLNPNHMEVIKERRMKGGIYNEDDVTPERLKQREKVKLDQYKMLKRNMEYEN